MTTAKLTGPQLEVIALLANGRDVNQIAAITGGTQASVNGHIRDACAAVGANDRIHLMAVAYRAGLLHVPAAVRPAPTTADPAEVKQLRDELTRTQAALATARREMKEARRAVTDARQDQAVADARAAGHDAAQVELAQLREQVIEAQAAYSAVRAELATEKQRVHGLRSNLQQAHEARDRAIEEAEETRRLSGTQRVALARPIAPGVDPAAAAAIGWCLDKLAGLAKQARDGASYGGGTPQLVDRANTLAAAANAIDQAWQRRLKASKGAGRA